eukprot:g878.t1
MKSPTSGALKNCTWTMLQQNPDDFRADHLIDMMNLLGFKNYSQNFASCRRVGVTFQWELLDCFLSPHSCDAAQVARGIRNFLAAAVDAQVPVEITLDPVQFYYASNIWNWFDPEQPGYDPQNVDNVEWTGWDPHNATKIAWRNWGSQFRMPTPQPNLASPKLLNITSSALTVAIHAIRDWWNESNRTDSQRSLLVGVKLGEEVDVCANYYFYPKGNEYLEKESDDDPTYGPQWSEGLFGGLASMGYNMLSTLGIRTTGGPPTRDEITEGIRFYFSRMISACITAWPELAHNDLLVTHAGHVGDPYFLRWDAGMIAPAIPGFSFYPGNIFEGKGSNPFGQPGLHSALRNYHRTSLNRTSDMRYVIAETACFQCRNATDWVRYFELAFNETMNPYGKVRYMRYYNIGPFIDTPGAVEGLKRFILGVDN